MTQAAILAASGSPGTTTGFKNRIINGNMVIDQRNAGASFTVPSGGGYTLDRWNTQASAASKFTVQQSSTAPTGFVNSAKLTSSSAYSLGASDFFQFQQYIEGYNTADLGFGTANAKTVTLSFWVNSSLTGTFGLFLISDSTNRIYPTSYTINSANTWEQKTITLTGDVTGTWNTTNSTGLRITWALGYGSNYANATANAWAANSGTNFIPSGCVNFLGTNGATFYITGVQLEVGTTATNFDFRSIGTELQLCQRYYEKAYDYDVQVPPASSTYAWFTPTNTSAIGNSALHTNIKYSVAKRARPTVTVYPFTTPSNTTRVSDAHSNSDFGANSGAVYIGRVNQVSLYNNSGGSLSLIGGEYGLNFGWSADAEL
jgi:hypothetical protein